jgi:hypothetical protein
MGIGQFLKAYKIELSGILAWALFTFAATKLCGVYIHKPFSSLITYNVSAVLALLYFFSYYRQEFSLNKFFIVSLSINILAQSFLVLYNWLLNLSGSGPEFDIAGLFAVLVVNMIVLSLVYSLMRVIVNRKK